MRRRHPLVRQLEPYLPRRGRVSHLCAAFPAAFLRNHPAQQAHAGPPRGKRVGAPGRCDVAARSRRISSSCSSDSGYDTQGWPFVLMERLNTHLGSRPILTMTSRPSASGIAAGMAVGGRSADSALILIKRRMTRSSSSSVSSEIAASSRFSRVRNTAAFPSSGRMKTVLGQRLVCAVVPTRCGSASRMRSQSELASSLITLSIVGRGATMVGRPAAGSLVLSAAERRGGCPV